MPEPVNPIFEATADDWESTFLSVESDGRIVVKQGSYSAALSLADSLGLAALVFARHVTKDHGKFCVCGHRYGVHFGDVQFGGGCGGAEAPYHEQFLSPPADLAHCSCKGFEAKP